ncbi:MAG: hypothetical protein ACM3S2_21585 [Ignavibacteriales bacterium]
MKQERRNIFFWTWVLSIIVGILLILGIFFMEEKNNSTSPSTQGTPVSAPAQGTKGADSTDKNK